MSSRPTVSKILPSVITSNRLVPGLPILFKVSNAQVMTEGISSEGSLPKVGDIIDMEWIKDVDDQAEYELAKQLLSTNGEVLLVDNLPEFYLVTVKLF